MRKRITNIITISILSVIIINPVSVLGLGSSSSYKRIISSAEGIELDANGTGQSVSGNGRYIIYDTAARGIVSTDIDNLSDVYVYDTLAKSTRLVSSQESGSNFAASVDNEGRYAAYFTISDLSQGVGSLHVKDMQTNSTNTIVENTGILSGAVVSDNGSRLFYIAPNYNVYSYDIISGAITQITSDADPNNRGYDIGSVASDGNRLIYTRHDRVPVHIDILMYDFASGEAANITNHETNYAASGIDLSSDGRFVSYVHNNVNRPIEGQKLYVYDTFTGARALVKNAPYQSNNSGQLGKTEISRDGMTVAYNEQFVSESRSDRKVTLLDRNSGASTTLCSELAASCAFISLGNNMSSDGTVMIFSYSPDNNLINMPYYYVGDQLAPLVTGNVQPVPNANGWHNSAVMINWSTTDPYPSSGVSSTPAATLADKEGIHTYVSDQACDNAGNCGTGSYIVKLDTVPPNGVFTGSSVVLKLLGQGVSGSAGDGLSGVQKVELVNGSTVLGSDNGQISLSCDAAKTSCSWTVASGMLTSGAPNLILKVTDLAGNVFTTTKQYIIL